jgi:glycerol-3-phosphate dehydrogenase
LLDVKKSSKTKTLSLHGARGARTSNNPGDAHLYSRYGSYASDLKKMIEQDPTLGQELVPGLPYLRCEAIYAVTHEMAVTVDDVLTRRTRARLLDRRACVAAVRDVATLIGPHLGWDDTTRDASVAQFIDECAREDAAAMVTEAEFIASHS